MEIKEEYKFNSNGMPIEIKIYKTKEEFVPIYDVSISLISKNTEIILEKIRQELITEVNLGIVDITDIKRSDLVNQRLTETINLLIDKHFPNLSDKIRGFLKLYLAQKSLGMGNIEILNNDSNLEEIAINSSDEPVWVFHRKYGWLKTNITVESEDQIKHYASLVGKKVGRQINVLAPLMDANLTSGDRVNSTLMPISLNGNTITMRKFASKPWTITDFIKTGTISSDAAALVWLGVQYELSIIIAGGTATGKTSMLNVVSNFFPPNQRIISIEDTHEIQLPKFLHWIPMITRLSNPEGKGAITMLDLLVNSLRMRPDRIVVGEIRRKEEAQVLFEAIHTGHSVYATVHANDTEETITRLINPPINIPKTMLPAVSMILVQYRNRRTGKRSTFQISEILKNGSGNVLTQYNMNKDKFKKMHDSISIIKTLQLFTGMTKKRIDQDIKEKSDILKWMVNHDINTVNNVGKVMAEYYTNKAGIIKMVKANKGIEFEENTKKQVIKKTKDIPQKTKIKRKINIKKMKIPFKKRDKIKNNIKKKPKKKKKR